MAGGSSGATWTGHSLPQPKVGRVLRELPVEAELCWRMQTRMQAPAAPLWSGVSLCRGGSSRGSFWGESKHQRSSRAKAVLDLLGLRWLLQHHCLPVDLAVMAAWREGAGMGQGRLERRRSSESEKH